MRRDPGFSLIELIVFIVILSVGITGILLPIATSIRNSADPLVARQMVLIADSLMDEIMAQEFTATSTCTGASRTDYNTVACYNGYSSNGIYTIDGSPIAGLTGYSVTVTVNAATLANVAAGNAVRIAITVTQGSNSFTLEGYRLAYDDE